MCVASPGKVVELNENTALVDFSGNKVRAYRGPVKVEVGDYVLVHAGCIIQTLKPSEAIEMVELMGGLE